MIIDIYVNDQFYKRKDLGTATGYVLGAITDEIRRDYNQGLLSDIAPVQDYKLNVRVVQN
jgi:hypothetical protein